jgi:hypothetical protein
MLIFGYYPDTAMIRLIGRQLVADHIDLHIEKTVQRLARIYPHVIYFFGDIVTDVDGVEKSTDAQVRQPRVNPYVRKQIDRIYFASVSDIHVLTDALDAHLAAYGVVSLADLNELAGITGHFSDRQWGWTELPNSFKILSEEQGWTFDLPPAKPL